MGPELIDCGICGGWYFQGQRHRCAGVLLDRVCPFPGRTFRSVAEHKEYVDRSPTPEPEAGENRP